MYIQWFGIFYYKVVFLKCYKCCFCYWLRSLSEWCFNSNSLVFFVRFGRFFRARFCWSYDLLHFETCRELWCLLCTFFISSFLSWYKERSRLTQHWLKNPFTPLQLKKSYYHPVAAIVISISWLHTLTEDFNCGHFVQGIFFTPYC